MTCFIAVVWHWTRIICEACTYSQELKLVSGSVEWWVAEKGLAGSSVASGSTFLPTPQHCFSPGQRTDSTSAVWMHRRQCLTLLHVMVFQVQEDRPPGSFTFTSFLKKPKCSKAFDYLTEDVDSVLWHLGLTLVWVWSGLPLKGREPSHEL